MSLVTQARVNKFQLDYHLPAVSGVGVRHVRDSPLEYPMHLTLLCVFSQERSWYQPVHYAPGFAFGRHAAVLHQHHDEVLKPVVTSFPWVSLLYDRAVIEPERVDFVFD